MLEAEPAADVTPAAYADSRRPTPLLLALGLYMPAAALLVWLCRHQLNVDGVSYLRIAGYYATGRFDLAITGYWAPLLSWLLAPLHWLGGDMVLAGHVLNALCGAGFVVATGRLADRLQCGHLALGIVPLAAALLALAWQGLGILADPLFTLLLTVYFVRSLAMSRSLALGDAAMAGVLGACCYYAKYYALPFFLLHHFLAACLVPLRAAPLRARLRCWMAGTAVFAACVAPWVATLSNHHGRFTFATTGTVVHSLAGPVVPDGDYWPSSRLMLPREGRLATWENPDEFTTAWPTWSPLSWPDGVVHQARLLIRNLREVVAHIFGMDTLGLLYVALCAAVLIAMASRRGGVSTDPGPWRWGAATGLAYLSGLFLVFAGTRRYYWPLEGLLLGLAALGISSLSDALKSGRCLRTFLPLLLVCSCGLPLLDAFRGAWGQPGRALAEAASELQRRGVRGPLAANNWHLLLPLGYRLGERCVGVPLPSESFLEDLQAAGARTFVEFTGLPQPSGAARLPAVIHAKLGPPAQLLRVGDLDIRVFDVTQAILASSKHAH